MQSNWFKLALNNPYVRGALLLVFFWTNYQPKPKSLAAVGWYAISQTQGAIAKVIPNLKIDK